MKILILDDERQWLKIFKDNLKRDHEVVACNASDQAVDSIHDHDFDLIVSDVSMPTRNGPDTIDMIRRIKPEYSEVPVVFVSALDCETCEELTKDVPCSTRWSKDKFSPSEFRAFIQQIEGRGFYKACKERGS